MIASKTPVVGAVLGTVNGRAGKRKIAALSWLIVVMTNAGTPDSFC